MKIDLKRFFRKFKNFGCKLNPVYKTIKIPKWSPKEDITVYELALCKNHPQLWKNEEHLIKWWDGLPENVKRHYELIEQKCIVDWDY
jgi:hypothetical protein